MRRLLDEGRHFSFFQAVRLLQVLHPDAARVGEQGPPSKEVVRFTGVVQLAFPPADVVALDDDEERLDHDEQGSPVSPRYRLASAFLGLYGPSSPLPSSYTEDLMDQEPDCLERGFYDLFQHRLTSLFYRAWERYRYEVTYRPDGSDFFSTRLRQLFHLDDGDDRSRAEALGQARFPWQRLMAMAGLLTQEPRSLSSLDVALRGLFPGLNVELHPYTGRWINIPRRQSCRLGQVNSTLGEDCYLGEEIFDRGASFTLTVEARDLDEFQEFLPGGPGLSRLNHVISLFNSNGLDYELELVLPQEDVPEFLLGSPYCNLGWSTWFEQPPEPERRVRIFCQGASNG